jgi:pimeloyl-ACP methyl ester carboxylesterase
MGMMKKLELLKQYLNGLEAEKFQEYYYGKFFCGTMTLIDGKEIGSLYFENGVVVSVAEGEPENGIDIGLEGTPETWNIWAKYRRSLTIVCQQLRRQNKTGFRTLGETLRFRQNNNALAFVGRLYSYVRDGVEPGSDVPKRDPARPASTGAVSIRGFYVRVNGIKIYCETNDAPDDKAVIICLHTAGRENRQYHDMMEIFAGRYRMIAIDMPGHGKSWPLPGNKVINNYKQYGQWIWDVIQALGVENPIVIGCSMAGGITFHIAQEHPVRGIVCMQGSDNTEDDMVNGVLEMLFHPHICPQHSHLEFSESLVGTRTNQDRVDFINWGVLCEIGKIKQGDLTETSSFNVSDKMDRVTCPVMIIEGVDDQAYTPEMAQACLNRLVNCKNKRLKLLEGYGHFVIIENPEKVCECMEEFIRSL